MKASHFLLVAHLFVDVAPCPIGHLLRRIGFEIRAFQLSLLQFFSSGPWCSLRWSLHIKLFQRTRFGITVQCPTCHVFEALLLAHEAMEMINRVIITGFCNGVQSQLLWEFLNVSMNIQCQLEDFWGMILSTANSYRSHLCRSYLQKELKEYEV